ncbi:hypothetical protein CRG98_033260 [Punica granatum]|uniref:Uncharacterized protein n=1 Tax=Punica granatum TaxID=22663 RepID=A0A2I0IQT9_PUNGR|nr:hypothetical protein CRG98_033260 [Punica granatum]
MEVTVTCSARRTRGAELCGRSGLLAPAIATCHIKKNRRGKGSGQPIGVPEPSTEGADADNLGGGVGVADWRPLSRIDQGPRWRGQDCRLTDLTPSPFNFSV